MKISPNKELIEHLSKNLQAIVNYLDRNLTNDWECYVQPYLNGYIPDIFLLNPKVGIHIIEVHESIQNIDEQNEYDQNPLIRLQNKKDFINDNLLHLGRSISKNQKQWFGLTGTSVAAPDMSPSDLKEKIQEWQRKQTTKIIDPKYLTSISSETVKQDQDIAEIITTKRESSFMTEAIASYIRLILGVSDYYFEKLTPIVVTKLLDKKQQSIIFLDEQKTQKMRGSTGSGKTLIIAGKAVELSKKGKSVVILVYNKTLVTLILEYIERVKNGDSDYKRLKDFFSQNLGKIRVEHYEGFLKDQFEKNQYGHKRKELYVANKGKPKKQLKELSKFLIDKIDLSNPNSSYDKFDRFDAILVDEGQNFITQMWKYCLKLRKSNGYALFALDERQDIYTRNKDLILSEMPGRWTELQISYRLPENFIPYIIDFGEKFSLDEKNIPLRNNNQLLTGIEECNLSWENIQLDNKTNRDLEVASGVDKVKLKSRKEEIRRKNLVKRCANLIEKEFIKIIDSYSFSDVVVISSSILAGRELVEQLEHRNINIFHTFHKDKDQEDQSKKAFSLVKSEVKSTTLHSFIGYESPLIIYLLEESSKSPETVYTALTRLRMGLKTKKCYLKVLCTNPKYFEYGKTWQPEDDGGWLTV